MLAAEAAFEALAAGRSGDELGAYPEAFERSWLHTELGQSRNFKQWFNKGSLVGALMTGIEQWLLPRLGMKRPPWTIHRTQADHSTLRPAAEMPQISCPKPDGSAVILRVLQCVAATGLVCVVSSTKRATSTLAGGAPRGKSRSIPASRDCAYRWRQRETCTRPTLNRSAMSLFCMPSAASSTMRARCASLTLVRLERTSLDKLGQFGALFVGQHDLRGTLEKQD